MQVYHNDNHIFYLYATSLGLNRHWLSPLSPLFLVRKSGIQVNTGKSQPMNHHDYKHAGFPVAHCPGAPYGGESSRFLSLDRSEGPTITLSERSWDLTQSRSRSRFMIMFII